MADEERQRERKRQRRKARADGEKAAGPAAEASGGNAEAQFEWVPDEPSSSTAAVAIAPPRSEPEPTNQESPEDTAPPLSAGPAAVAQIMATPSSRTQAAALAGAEATPKVDPFFAQRNVSRDEEPTAYEPPPPDDPFAHPPEMVAPAYEYERRWTHEPVLLALLLVAIIVLALNTYFTWRLNGLSDRLAAASKPAATAAVVAGGERPWVGVDSLRTAQFANGGQPVTTVHIVNSGHEPAYDLRSNTVGSLRSSSTPAPQVPTAKGPLATTGLLLPNTGGNLTFFANTRALTAQEAASVRSGQFVLWLAGRLDYKDSKGQAHLTTFRYRYNPQLNSFIAAPDGNAAN